MDTTDHQIPAEANFADYCDALRSKDYARFILAGKHVQKPEIRAGAGQQEKVHFDERSRTAP